MSRRQKLKWYDDEAKVGQRLRAAREARGVSQRALATTGCTAAYISRIEKGERVPSLQLMRYFAEQLGVSESFLAYGIESAAPERFALTEARVALRLGEIVEARRLADAALEVASSDRERALASALYGQIALAENDPRGAIDAIERARNLHSVLATDDPDAIDALGRAYARAGEFAAAIAVFTSAHEAAAQSGDVVNVVRFATLSAYAHSDTSDFDAAERALAIALRAAGSVDDPLTRARTLWAQSRLRVMQNDADTAAIYAERALEILEVADYGYYSALARQLLAHVELDRGNGGRAIELLEQAAPLIDAAGKPFESARLRIETARALLLDGRREEAAGVAMAAVSVVSGDLSVDAGRCYLLIGDVFASLDDAARAIELYELAVELLEPTPDRYLVEAYTKLAELFESQDNQPRAYELLKKALNVQTESGRSLTPG